MSEPRTKEQLLAALDMLEEQRRRLRDQHALYAPNAGQVKVHVSRAATRVVTSGNGSGKTTLAVHEALWAALGFNPISKEFTPVPCRVVVVIDHPQKADDLWLPEIKKWFNLTEDQIRKRGTHSTSQITFPNGSDILFLSHFSDSLLFESIELDVLICDEPPPRHVYIGLSRGGRKKHRKLKTLIVATPISGRWMRQEICDPWAKGELKDTECFKFGTVVNEQNLSDGYIDTYGAKLSDKERRIRLEGEFFDLEGLALAHLLDVDIHQVQRPKEWSGPVVCAIDPHPVKEHHAVLLGVDKEGFYYYLGETKKKMVARQFAAHLLDFMRPYRVVDIVCDSLGSQEGTGGDGFMSFIQVLRDEGVMARATTWDDKQDEDFVERIRDVLLIPDVPDSFGNRTPQLRIVNTCMGIWSDLENAQWVKVRMGTPGNEFKPKLDISNKDFLSCLKYALASNLTPSKGRGKMYVVNHNEASSAREHRPARVVKLRQHKATRVKKPSASQEWREW